LGLGPVPTLGIQGLLSIWGYAHGNAGYNTYDQGGVFGLDNPNTNSGTIAGEDAPDTGFSGARGGAYTQDDVNSWANNLTDADRSALAALDEAGKDNPQGPDVSGYTGPTGWSLDENNGWTYTDNFGNTHSQTSFYDTEDQGWSRDTNHGVGYGGYGQGYGSSTQSDDSWSGTNQSAGGGLSSESGGSTDFAAKGGYIKGDKIHGIDDVPGKVKNGQNVMLDGGEYIIPANITEMLGAHNLDRFMKLLGASPKVETKKVGA
jgi:hypothetical protein